MPKPNFEIMDEPTQEVIDAVEEGLISSVPKGIDRGKRSKIGVFLRDDEGRIVAGVTGKTWWGWLDIDRLWVHKDLRGEDIGTQLMQKAEEIACERGCHSSLLDTMDFQARDFYEKLGYKVFTELNDFPKGHSRYFLSKKL